MKNTTISPLVWWTRTVIVSLAFVSTTQAESTQKIFAARTGNLQVEFDIPALQALGMSVGQAGDDARIGFRTSPADNSGFIEFAAADKTDAKLFAGEISFETNRELTLEVGAYRHQFQSVTLVSDPFADDGLNLHLQLGTGRNATTLFLLNQTYQFEDASENVTITAELSYISATLRNEIIGQVTVHLIAELSQTITYTPDRQLSSGTLHPISPSAAGSFPTPGPDVIVGELPSTVQFGREGTPGSGTVGLAIGTTSCNKGDTPLNWEALPSVDHPMIPMNLYRMQTVDGSTRLEQVGQAWMKHAFAALQGNACSFGCTPGGPGLGVGCSDPYGAGLNAGQCGLGPRAALNPFTGAIPAGGNLGSDICSSNYPSRDHRGHTHNGISHRLQVPDVDLMASLNPGARYFSEGQYISPHEFTNAQSLANLNMHNNVSYREVSVTENPPGSFGFNNIGPTVREEPALNVWSAASQSIIQPDTFGDGRAILAYEVTQTGPSTWHYEYAIYNQNLDRSIGVFEVPIPAGVIVTNIGFHAPLNHAPELNTDNYSNDPWTLTTPTGAIRWSTESFGSNPNANAVRFGTLYNFRFDANSGPQPVFASVEYFKVAGSASPVSQGPSPVGPQDCNNNTIEDTCDIDCGAPGCGVPMCGESDDCNGNGVPDECEIPAPIGTCESFCANDCNANGIPDECEIDENSTAPNGPYFCTANCATDCDDNGVPDECQPDCNMNSVNDLCDVSSMTSPDCNGNDVPDECEIDENSMAPGGPFFCMMNCASDCNDSGTPDECDLSGNDCNLNGTPDDCEPGLVCECGNNIIEEGEQCDDGNTVPGDGCDEFCQSEFNDDCTSARVICPGTVSGTNVGSTNDGADGCSGSDDVWYTYTPGSDGVATADICGSNFDSVISIHTGCPGNTGNQIICDDDGCGGIGGPSTATFNVDADNTYLIRVAGWNGGTGNFDLNLSGPDCGDPGPECTMNSECEDMNPCTDNVCDMEKCTFPPNSDPCDDGDDCTSDDTCTSGMCVGGPPPFCDGVGCDDCNGNNIDDACESLDDCNSNSIPDICELDGNDCNANMIPDECEIFLVCLPGGGCSFVNDCNENMILDECEKGGDVDTDSDGIVDLCDNCPTDFNPSQEDQDGDDIGDVCDQCPGFDDNVDSDADGVADGCDLCPGSDDNIDADTDGVPDGCDVCPGFDDNVDSDADGVADGCDLCSGFDDNLDADADGVADGCDLCLGFDDNVDVNMNGVPDGCESCESDADCLDQDVCTYNECEGNLCDEFGIRYGDVAEPFGGIVQTSDILCAVGGFGNYSACPNADIAGCVPTGVPIGTNDILAVVGAFGGTDPCGCSGTSASSGVASSQTTTEPLRRTGNAVITLISQTKTARIDDLVSIDVFVGNTQDIIGYEIRANKSIKGLTFDSVSLDEQRRDYAFARTESVTALDQNLGRIAGVAIHEEFTQAEKFYVGTLNYLIDDAAENVVSMALDVVDIDLFRSANELIGVAKVSGVTVEIEPVDSRRTSFKR